MDLHVLLTSRPCSCTSASSLTTHLKQLSCDDVPHLDDASLTAAHDVALTDPGSQDGIFVFKCLQALSCVYVPF